MSTKITKRAIPHPTEAPNRKSVESLQVAVNELTGAVGENMQRAVRVCELVDAGILALQPNGQLGRNESIDQLGTIDMSDVTGLTAALNARVLKAGDTMTGQLLRTIAGMANNTNQLWLRAYSDNAAGEVSISYARGAVSNHGGINFNVANGAANNVTPLRLTPATGIPVFTTRVHNMTGTTGAQSVLRYMGYSNEVNRWSEVLESSGALAYYGYDATGAAAARICYMRHPSMGAREFVVDTSNLIVNNGDIYAYRSGGTTGVIFLRSDATRYLFYDGTNYVMPGGGLYIGGQIQSDTLTFTGLSGGQGFQMVWNTVQAGQGRFEIINNRGGGAGGFTWWDRANTGVGTGSALALLNANGYYVNGAIQFATGSATVGQLSSHPVFGTDYAALMGATMTGQEYVVLFNRAGADANTYISSITGGTVKIRPSANSSTGEVTFATTGVTFAQACTAPNFTATSDERLKDVLPTTPGYYPRIGELQLAEWTWTKDGKPGRGVVAQQVRDVAPGYVHEDPTTGILSVDKAGLALELAMLALNLHRSCPCCSATSP